MKYKALFILIFLGLSCSGGIDWNRVGFYCDKNRPCRTGFECIDHKCIAKKDFDIQSTFDSSSKSDINTDFQKDSGNAPAKLRVAFMCEGVPGDYGWTWTFNQAKDYLQDLGYDTTCSFAVNPADTARVVKDFVNSGYNVIVANTPNYVTSVLSVASNYPDVKFLVCGGFHTSTNVGTFYGRMYQVTWLAGMAAGTLTKTGKIGVVSTLPGPENVRQINAFALGVRKANPHADVVVTWTLSTTSPQKEQSLTQELLDKDCDVIFAHTFSSAPIVYIENSQGDPLTTKDGHTVYTIGYGTNSACKDAARTCLGAPIYNWGALLKRILKGIKDGQWDKFKNTWEQVKNSASDSVVYMGPTELANKVLGPEALSSIEQNISRLTKPEGKYLPFVGPIKDNKGKLRIAANHSATDNILLRMCWFVQGIKDLDGHAPQVPDTCIGDH